jgi:hypothetical protein
VRTIIIADCHGNPWLIENVIKNSEFVEGEDRLVFAGDIVDIGDQAEECLWLLLEYGAEILWGNHDFATVYGQWIAPQSQYDEEFVELLRNVEFKVATNVGVGTLVTHAGVSLSFFGDFVGYEKALDRSSSEVRVSAEKISDALNELDPVMLAQMEDGPFWYRPRASCVPMPYVRQVVGHTPPEWIKVGRGSLVSVDPYLREGFDKNRHRYILVDEKTTKLRDSVFGDTIW